MNRTGVLVLSHLSLDHTHTLPRISMTNSASPNSSENHIRNTRVQEKSVGPSGCIARLRKNRRKRNTRMLLMTKQNFGNSTEDLSVSHGAASIPDRMPYLNDGGSNHDRAGDEQIER